MFYIKKRNFILGPFDKEQIEENFRSKKIQPYDEISESRNGPWISMNEWSTENTTVEALILPEPSKSESSPPVPNNANFSNGGDHREERFSTEEPEKENNELNTKWFYRMDDSEPGPPVSEKTLRSMIKKGDLDKGFYVWNENMEDWAPIKKIFAVDFQIKKNRDIERKQKTNNKLDRKVNDLDMGNIEKNKFNEERYRYIKKSVVVAYLLYFLLPFGVHQFYIGNTRKGFSYIGTIFLIIIFSSNSKGENPAALFGAFFIFIMMIWDFFTLWMQVDKANQKIMASLRG